MDVAISIHVGMLWTKSTIGSFKFPSHLKCKLFVHKSILELYAHLDPGRSLPYEIQNHVRPNFATPMLYVKNHSKFYKVFCTTIKPLELYFVNF
jgi:hypothetical protein